MKESNKQRAKRTSITPSTIITPKITPEPHRIEDMQWIINTTVFGAVFVLSTLALVFL